MSFKTFMTTSRFMAILLICFLVVAKSQEEISEQQCAWKSGVENDCILSAPISCDDDKNLHDMKFSPLDDNDEQVVFKAYVTPDVSSFYANSTDTGNNKKPAKPWFQGQFAKFINMSPESVWVFWDGGKAAGGENFIAQIGPFESAGTASFPGHKFVVRPVTNPSSTVFVRWTVTSQTSIYVYDPFSEKGSNRNESELTPSQLRLYKLQQENLNFGRQYLQHTGREWLSLYPSRQRPNFPIWPADFFGQEHIVTTQETHYTSMPPDEITNQYISHTPVKTAEERRQLIESSPHRPSSPLELKLKVLSCAPRVLEIENFLSEVEIEHVLNVATGVKLERSTTKAGEGADGNADAAKQRRDSTTRTSRNSWLAREQSPILDTIYRRAADLLGIHEETLRSGFNSQSKRHQTSRAEQLQLVHYDVGQQYTAHHDFMVPDTNSYGQPMRFATILFYLNDEMEGGETSFPRWLNAHTGEQLKVTPEVGKAILFYNLLPDGNMDERSQHAALPVIKGEKWLINLWIWDPTMTFRTGFEWLEQFGVSGIQVEAVSLSIVNMFRNYMGIDIVRLWNWLRG